MPRFSSVSRRRLLECHPDIIRVLEAAIARIDFSVICGHRTQVEQDAAFEAGYSKLKWPKGKHNKKPSLAVDVIPYPAGFKANKEEWAALAAIILEEAKKLGVDLKWGGNWKKFVDKPHFEL
jgi:peptidoglycan L-alanyl-D-glutamate endopeptidase CwlK